MTNSALLKTPATKAAAWLGTCQHSDGGWGDGKAPDPLLTALSIMALHSADISGLEISPDIKRRVDGILDRLTDGGIQGRFEPAASAAILSAAVLWKKKREPAWLEWAARTGCNLEKSNARNPVLTYWETCALTQYGDPQEQGRKAWSKRLREQLKDLQRTKENDALRGSWDPPEAMSFLTSVPPKSIPPEIRQRAEELIEELSDAEWSVRERATQGLIRLGPVVLPLLEPATTHRDPEVVHRATHVRLILDTGVDDVCRIETVSLNVASLLMTYERLPCVFGAK